MKPLWRLTVTALMMKLPVDTIPVTGFVIEWPASLSTDTVQKAVA
ncbi:MAG: hypothetical protein NTW90_03585 [Nitrosospira sp.]|nr:hypothetical protein [Nitrosospira sp.]